MRRHYANYFRGYPDFKVFRSALVKEIDPLVVNALLDEINDKYFDFTLEKQSYGVTEYAGTDA